MATWALVTSLFLFAACGDDRPSAEARERERILLDDPIRQLEVPGGVFRGEGSTAGSPADANYDRDDVTVNRSWLFEGDPVAIAAPVAHQVHEFGWVVTSGACREEYAQIRAKRAFDGFEAYLAIDVWIKPSGEREVRLQITAPYPGEEPTGSFPIRPQVPPCLGLPPA